MMSALEPWTILAAGMPGRPEPIAGSDEPEDDEDEEDDEDDEDDD